MIDGSDTLLLLRILFKIFKNFQGPSLLFSTLAWTVYSCSLHFIEFLHLLWAVLNSTMLTVAELRGGITVATAHSGVKKGLTIWFCRNVFSLR